MLRHTIGLVRATAIVVGIIIGASIFVQPSEVSRHVSTVRAMFGVWAAAGLISICGALVSAALAARFPETGGVYVYLKKTISSPAAFLWGWAMFWSMHSGIIAAIATVLGRYAAVLVPLSDTGMRAVAVASILVLSAVNYFGVRAGSNVQVLFTIAKLAAIAAILIAVLFATPQIQPSMAAPSAGTREFFLGISAGLFAFGGWHMVTYAAGETVDARKTVPRALFIGMSIVTACYLALNAAYLRVLPLKTVLNSQHVAADAASVLMGPRGAMLVAGLVLVSAFGALNGIILAGPRVYYAMANDGLAWSAAGKTHPRFETPHIAILAQAVWASVLVATGTYRVLFTRVVYTEFLFFGIMTIGLMRVEKKLSLFAILFLSGCVLVVSNQILSDWKESAVGLLIVAAGLPVYYLVKANANYRLP